MNEDVHDLQHIRSLMDRSTRFLSLSGLSGVSAGAIALLGAFVAHRYIGAHLDVPREPLTYVEDGTGTSIYWEHMTYLATVASSVLVLALGSAFWFTWRRSRKLGHGQFDRTARRLAVNLLIPLAAGGSSAWPCCTTACRGSCLRPPSSSTDWPCLTRRSTHWTRSGGWA